MVVGDGGSVVNGSLNGGMTKDENRVHFGGWCIVSSPLILAYNLSTPERRELVWDIITVSTAERFLTSSMCLCCCGLLISGGPSIAARTRRRSR